MDREMNLDWIVKPHHWSPRRLYSQTGADWQQRVNFERLRKERLQRAREAMNAHDLGAFGFAPICSLLYSISFR